MEITIEQVERLMEKGNISYEEAKAALEDADGNLLDAVIALERDGKIDVKSSETCTAASPPISSGAGQEGSGSHAGYDYGNESSGKQFRYKDETTGAGDAFKKIWDAIVGLVDVSIKNHFHVIRDGNKIIDIPILLLVVLLVGFFWASVPLLIIGLFCRCKYKFWGPDYEPEDINRVMDEAAKACDDIKV